MDTYVTAADLARIYGVATGTIYRWASQDRWHRTQTWPRRYSRDDAQASYGRRHSDTRDQGHLT